MSITWYKLKIKKQLNEYECYIRFKFDSQMQSIRIKAFIYLTDSEGNICVKDKKNKLGYDPRILGSLTVEKNFLKHKRKNSSSTYYEVMKYQGNFNICNLPLIDDYFRNGKALIFQYKDMIYLMDNKKYKIQMNPKKFTIILDVINYGYISLNLFNKLEEVEKQELIFLKQNENALCHRYFSNKFIGSQKNKKDGEEIEIIEENKNFNQLGGRICIGRDENDNINLEEEKDKKEEENNINFFNDYDKDYEANSDDSSVYDSIFFTNGNDNNDKLNINNSKFFLNGKDFSNDNPNCNIILSGIQNSNSKKSSKSKEKNKLLNYNFNNINNINTNNNNENRNNLFVKLKKEDNNIFNNNKINNYSNQNQNTNSNSNKKEKELNFFEKAKNIVKNYNFQKDTNTSETSSYYSQNKNNYKTNDYNHNHDNQKNFASLCNRILSQKSNEPLISNESERKILLCSSGFDNNKYNLKLLYKSTLHGDNINIFHKKCDNKKNIFLLILTLDNKKFGFYTSVGLSTDKKTIYDNKAFLFKLSKEEMDCFHIKNKEIAFYGYNDYILYLGGEQLIIRDKFLSGASSCGLKMKNYRLNNNYQINNGNKNFIIKELEVYNVSEI